VKRVVIMLAVVVVAAACSGPKQAARFQYRQVVEPLPPGKSDGLSPEELAIEEGLKKVAASPACGAYFGKMFKNALLVLKDHDGLTFSGSVKDGACSVARGTTPGVDFDYIVPADTTNLAGMAGFFEDGTISEEENYLIHYVTYVSGLQNGFRVAALYREDVAAYLALPNVIHFTLLNPKGFAYRGSTAPRRATAVNVDGQWIVFEGARGEPDMKIEVTPEQSEQYASLLFAPSTKSDQERLQDVKAFIDSVTVWRKPKG
jgi:hypothetical protein